MNIQGETTDRAPVADRDGVVGLLSRLTDGAKTVVDRGRATIDDVPANRNREALLRELCEAGAVEPHASGRDLLEQLAALGSTERTDETEGENR